MHFFATFFWKAYTTNQQKNAIICGQSFACKKKCFWTAYTTNQKENEQNAKLQYLAATVYANERQERGGTGRLINARSSGRNYRIWEGFGFDSCCAYWLPGFQRPALPALGWWRTALRRCWSKRKRCPVLEQSGGGDSGNTSLMSVADMGFSSK